MDPLTLKRITDEFTEIVHGGIPNAKNKKKLYEKNMAMNSEEFK